MSECESELLGKRGRKRAKDEKKKEIKRLTEGMMTKTWGEVSDSGSSRLNSRALDAQHPGKARKRKASRQVWRKASFGCFFQGFLLLRDLPMLGGSFVILIR